MWSWYTNSYWMKFNICCCKIRLGSVCTLIRRKTWYSMVLFENMPKFMKNSWLPMFKKCTDNFWGLYSSSLSMSLIIYFVLEWCIAVAVKLWIELAYFVNQHIMHWYSTDCHVVSSLHVLLLQRVVQVSRCFSSLHDSHVMCIINRPFAYCHRRRRKFISPNQYNIIHDNNV